MTKDMRQGLAVSYAGVSAKQHKGKNNTSNENKGLACYRALPESKAVVRRRKKQARCQAAARQHCGHDGAHGWDAALQEHKKHLHVIYIYIYQFKSSLVSIGKHAMTPGTPAIAATHRSRNRPKSKWQRADWHRAKQQKVQKAGWDHHLTAHPSGILLWSVANLFLRTLQLLVCQLTSRHWCSLAKMSQRTSKFKVLKRTPKPETA